MPSTSKKQHNFMAMVAHNPKMAKKVGVPQSVGAEFTAADKGKKFKNGGGPVLSKFKNLFKGKETPKEEMKEAKAVKSGKITPAQYAKGEKMEKAMPVHRGMKKGGKVKCYSGTNESVVKATPKPAPKDDRSEYEKRLDEMPKDFNPEPDQTPKKKTMKKGGMTSCYSKGGGIEVRGKTKGRFV